MDDIEQAVMRNEYARVIVIALLSQGYIAGTDAPSIGLAFLRELEEQGFTLRLTTDEERSARGREMNAPMNQALDEPVTGEPER